MKAVTSSEKIDYFERLQHYATPVSRIVDIGILIPDRIVGNEEIASLVDAPYRLKQALPEIILRTTGNQDRVYAQKGTVPSDLAVGAIADLVTRTGVDIREVDTLIFASTDMDIMEPATANIVQERIGLRKANAFDVTNACNSFLQAMNVSNSLIATGAARRVIICSGELGSAVCNREIKDVRDLRYKMGGLTLGDGGAAILMEAADGPSGLTEINLMSFGEHWQLCHIPDRLDWRTTGKPLDPRPWFYLDMPALAKIARRYTLEYLREYERLRHRALGERHFMEAMAHFVPHQISRKLIEDVCGEMNFDMERVAITAHLYGNTASTSIPIALRWLIDQGKLTLGSGQECFLYGAASGFGLGHIRFRA